MFQSLLKEAWRRQNERDLALSLSAVDPNFVGQRAVVSHIQRYIQVCTKYGSALSVKVL